MNWSRKDENRHAEVQRELTELDRRRSVAYDHLHEVLSRCLDDRESFSTAKVIKNADALRDALEPFDSGCRQAKEA